MAGPQRNSPLLGTALVVGGCGFVGYHIVRHLLQDADCASLYVFDRTVHHNRLDGVTYVQGDITDAEALQSFISKVQPTVLFHTASPIASSRRRGDFVETNIHGTKHLLDAASQCASVKAFVFTSSVDVYTNPPHSNVAENHPLWRPDDYSNEYRRTKAVGEAIVLAANSTKLPTVALRLAHAYGERHVQGLQEMYDMFSKGQKLVQIGQGHNVMEVASADNCASAHILAAKALIDPSLARGKVDGEAFNVSDGAPVPFWHHTRIVWLGFRSEEDVKQRLILPAWIMVLVVHLTEWLLWMFTLGTISPQTALSRTSLEYCLYSHTYDISRARENLGFSPVVDHDRVLADSVAWFMRQVQGIGS